MMRQGDVLLIPISEFPEGAKAVPREDGRVVLAHGEATGHAHAIDSRRASLWALGDLRVLKVRERVVTLHHEEHAPVEIPEGLYRVVRQREYSPEEIRNVAD